MTTANIKINGVTGSNTDWSLNTLVPLTTDTTGSSYLWSLVSQPAGAPDALVDSNIQSPYFTPTKEGSYLIKLIVNAGGPTEATGQVVLGVRELQTGNRIPAIGETTEASQTDGWASAAVDEILQRVTRMTDSGVISGVAGEDLTVGQPVYASGVATIAATLPGERQLLEFRHSFATDPLELQGNMGVVIGAADGGATTTGKVVRVLAYGLYQGVSLVGSPAIGDPVYVSDLGTLDLTAGTHPRAIGTVAAVGGSTYDVFIGGEQAIPFGPAVGDLTGLFPGPTIASLQGQVLDVMTVPPSAGQVLGYVGGMWKPTTNSAPPTGHAGGVLGYSGSSSYPNPAGLAPTVANVIPVAPGNTGNVTYFSADTFDGIAASPGLVLRGGANTGLGPGGLAKLLGGDSTSSQGGGAYLVAGNGSSGGDVVVIAGEGNNAGGQISVTGGYSGVTAGGNVSISGGEGATVGGDLFLTGGIGGATSGGNVSMQAGDGPSNGGSASVLGGSSSTTGGAVSIAGGGCTGTNVSSQAGSIAISGGSTYAVPSGVGAATVAGHVVIAGGDVITADEFATTGGVVISGGLDKANFPSATLPTPIAGTVVIDGGSYGYVKLGSSGKNVLTSGRNVEAVDSRAAVNATTLPVNAPTILLTNSGAIDLNGGNPEVQTSGITQGTRVTIIQTGTGSTVFRSTGSDATSALKLSNASHTLGQYDAMTLVFTGTYWVELAYVNN